MPKINTKLYVSYISIVKKEEKIFYLFAISQAHTTFPN